MKTYGKIFIYELHLCSRGAKTLKLTKTHQPKIVEVRLTSAKLQSIYIKLLEEKDLSVAQFMESLLEQLKCTSRSSLCPVWGRIRL